jgi:hypothetical protein
MLPSYPPHPPAHPHVTGFDMMLVYGLVEEPDHELAHEMVQELRRQSVRLGAKMSAAKALAALRWFSKGVARLCVTQELAAEAPTPESLSWLASEELYAGHRERAVEVNGRMLLLAEQLGDLDQVAIARHRLTAPIDAWNKAARTSYDTRINEAGSLRAKEAACAYDALLDLRGEALGRGGLATAVRCVRKLLRVAAATADVPAGLDFARELVELQASSFSHLAVALAQERAGSVDAARGAFAEALRWSRAEGDLHRATKATAGLVRTSGGERVSVDLLEWAMPEALKESPEVPDYRYLAATLGRMGLET